MEAPTETHSMKLFRLAAAAAGLLLATALTVQAQEPGAEINWLMVVQGRVAAVDGDRMVLEARPSAIVFSDRPERLVGMLDLGSFAASAWGEAGVLSGDPPNASVINETAGAITIIVVSDMAYAEGSLTISFELLSGAAPSAGDELGITIDAFPTAVNSQITDSVTQANVKVVGEAPAMAMGNLFVPE